MAEQVRSNRLGPMAITASIHSPEHQLASSPIVRTDRIFLTGVAPSASVAARRPIHTRCAPSPTGGPRFRMDGPRSCSTRPIMMHPLPTFRHCRHERSSISGPNEVRHWEHATMFRTFSCSRTAAPKSERQSPILMDRSMRSPTCPRPRSPNSRPMGCTAASIPLRSAIAWSPVSATGTHGFLLLPVGHTKFSSLRALPFQIFRPSTTRRGIRSVNSSSTSCRDSTDSSPLRCRS